MVRGDGGIGVACGVVFMFISRVVMVMRMMRIMMIMMLMRTMMIE
jgi:hypothetical protein